eukprot:CAMPEP_0185776024 /NCGR_PEP_ID=MMETSP1174-20130828/84137_1 /TAXON_ID=35687 /ORGANISM="Dictyocha speculum, Strain CCMP1381" /LENGTH=465 /DNA_ID=CAMNT_0028463793 /DNA_START=19 /DNA_END=1416 /DNA_ORIENTATION=-
MSDENDSSYPSNAYAMYSLVLLAVIYTQNQWSRYILNYLYAVPYDDEQSDASKISMTYSCDLTSSDYGLLTGYGFSATFVVTGLFMGRAADMYNRKNIITVGCYIWNIALTGMGMSSYFWQLLCWRLVLGFGQAFSNPASYSMIADLFPPAQRATGNGIFASGVYIGGGLASISESIAESLGWRETMYMCAVVGAGVSTILFATVREPARQRAAESVKPVEESEEKSISTMDSLKLIFGSKKVCLLLCAASVRYMGGYAIAGYLPSMYDYVFTSYVTEYSYINAYVVAFGGFCSSNAGGRITQMWLEKGQTKANYYVPMIGCLLGCPFITICCLSSNFYVSLCVGLFGEYLVAECWFGPFIAALQSSLPNEARAMGVAVMMGTATFFGSLISYVIGVVYDSLVDSGSSYSVIRYIVLYSVLGTYLTSASLFYIGSQMEDDDSSESTSTLSEKSKLIETEVTKEEP